MLQNQVFDQLIFMIGKNHAGLPQAQQHRQVRQVRPCELLWRYKHLPPPDMFCVHKERECHHQCLGTYSLHPLLHPHLDYLLQHHRRR